MIKRILLSWGLFLSALLLPGSILAQAPPANPSGLTPAQAQQAIEVLQNPQKRAEVIAVLQAIAKAAPAVAPAPAPAGAAPPSSPVTLAPNSLGAQLLVNLSRWANGLSAEVAATTQALTNFPKLREWLTEATTDPAVRAPLLTAAGWVALSLLCALAAEFLATLLLGPPLAALAKHAQLVREGEPGDRPSPGTDHASARTGAGGAVRLMRVLPFAFCRLILELVPVAVFATTGDLMAGTIIGMTEETRLVVLAVVNAYAICRVVMCLGRMAVSPSDRRLRLWRLSNAQAAFVIAWLRRIAVVAVFGNAVIGVALLIGLDREVHDGLARLITLLLTLLLTIMVVRSRRGVADYIRASGASAGGWRDRLAHVWPYLAVVTIVSAGIGLAARTGDGVAGLYFPAVTLATVMVARLLAIVALGALDRMVQVGHNSAREYPGISERIAGYRRPIRFVIVTVITAISIAVLLQLWGADAFTWFIAGSIGDRLVSALLTVVIAVIAAVAVWEVTHALLDRRLVKFAHEESAARAARLRTLMPMLRTALLAVILTIVSLTALSEIGVNIAPLLAGAGIVGIAVGFGAQSLVHDVITGMFVLFENAIQIGDGITAAGLSGTVEQLSVRTIRLRAGDGAVHIIPFSAVTSITNTNRGLGNAVISVTVSYQEDTDRVAAVLSEIAAEIRQDADFSARVLADLQLFGVDVVRPWGVTITGQIQCTDTGRWPVQREFSRRMKKRFEELEIALGGPPNVFAQP